MAKYHGTRIPRGLDRSLRKTLEAHERALRRGSASLALGDSDSNIGVGQTAQKTLSGLSLYMEYGAADLMTLAPPLRGTEVTLRFLGATDVSNLGNLRLPSGGFTSEAGTVLKLVSDGDGSLFQVSSTAPGNERTFVPVRKWHLTPGTGEDLTAKAQAMFDDPASAGVVLVFEKGDYIINGVTITQSDTNIFLPPGCRIYTTATTPRAVFNVAGTINIAAATNVIQNPDLPFDNEYPRGGERTIYVASGAGAGFPVDSWFSIEDEEDVPPPGRWNGGSDPNYILEHHMELCRVKAVTPGGSGDRIDLWFPLVNSYAFIGIAPRLRTVVPVTNFKIWGGGTIQNHTTSVGGNASHGIVCAYTVGVTIENIRFNDVFDSCIHLLRCQDFRVTACEWRDPPRFDSRGYGITTYGGIRGIIQGNVARRLRHCVDLSFFSRIVTVDGNSLAGSTTGNLNTHPCVEGITFSNNVIDGGYGQEASSPSFEYGENVAAPQASGIDIDEHVRHASVIGNTIRNCRRAGIYVDMGHAGFPTEFITIIGNTLENCGTAQRLNHPPTSFPDVACIQLLEQWSGGNTRRGIVCKGNTLLNPGQYGIVSDISGVIIEGNWVARPASQVQKSDPVNIGIGIWVRGGATADCLNPMVKNNYIDNPVQQGVRVGKDLATFKVIGAVIEGNITVNGTGPGIFLEETAPNAIVRNNRSEGNTGDGLNTQSDNGLFEGNVSVGNSLFGIRLIGGADNNLLRNNIFSGPGYTNNASGEILDVGSGNFIVSHDLTNKRIGIGTNAPGGRFTLRLGTSPEPALYWRVGATATEVLWASQQSDVWDSATGYGFSMIQDESSTGDIFVRRHSGAGPVTLFQWGRGGFNGYGGARDPGLIYEHSFTGAAQINKGLLLNYSNGTDAATNSFRMFSTSFPYAGGVPLVGFDANTEGIQFGGDAADTAYARVVSQAPPNKDKAGLYISDNLNVGARDTLAIFIGNGNPAGAGVYGWRFDEDGTVNGDLKISSRDGGGAGVNKLAITFQRAGGVIINDGAGSWDLRAEGAADANLLFLKGSTDKVGIGTNAPAQKLDVRGGVDINSGAVAVDGLRVAVSGAGNANMLLVQDKAGSAGVVGIRKSAPADTLHVGGAIRSDATLRAGGTDAGVATFVSYTNVVAAPVGATPATLGNTGGAGDPAGAAQTHWLKIMDGTTARYIPVWT